MLSLVDDRTLFLALLALLAVSIITVELCRRDKEPYKGPDAFLFGGKKRIHGLASNVGALFSLTYFFGASFIYGIVFGWSFFLCAAIILVILLLAVPKVLVQIHERLTPPLDSHSNILLDYLKATAIDDRNFHSVLRLYIAIYLGLLVEELAVSRLVLTAVFPWNPLISALVLSTIVLVIYTYLTLGGFRAVLLSDLVQMIVVAVFVLCLIGLLIASRPEARSVVTSASTEAPNWLSLPFLILFGLSWFVAGVDFYSRLNFRSGSRRSPLRQRVRFTVFSLVSIFAMLFVGIAYGIRLQHVPLDLSTPTTYTFDTVEYFLGMKRPIIVVGFLASIICMVFTTVDTLFLTLLQLGRYQENARFSLEQSNLPRVVLMAVVLSTLLSFDATSAFGIFAGSLMILPLFVVAGAVSPLVRRFLPARNEVYEIAAGLSLVVFVYFYEDLRYAFGSHFLIPGMVFLVTSGTCLVASILQFLGEIRGKR